LFPLAFRLVSNLLRLPFWPLFWLGRLVFAPRAEWLHLKVRTRVSEFGPRVPRLFRYFPRFAKAAPTSVEGLRRFVRHAKDDRALVGVLVEIPSLMAGWATCASVRSLLRELRESGKKVVVYLPEGAGNRELYIASAADRVLAAPGSPIMATGLASESRYYKKLLDRWGVHVEPMAQGSFKTAGENLARESMSEPQREQLSALLGAIQSDLEAGLAELPALGKERVRAVFDRGFMLAEDAVDFGLVSAVITEDELPRAVAEEEVKLVRADRYLAFHEARFFRQLLPRPYIAVIDVQGPIVPSQAGLFGGSGMAVADRIVAELRVARRDPRAIGVILHVNSPGGSAFASERIYHEVGRLKEKKPVIAYFANVAASGGYYVAAGAHAIIAEPVTITGSIGVVSLKIVVERLLEKLGVHNETVRVAPHGDLFSIARPYTADEKSALDKAFRATYDRFLEIVANGRTKTVEQVEALAGGRVWSGKDALAHGLVDKLGGLELAREEIVSRTKVPYPDRIPFGRVFVRGDVPPPEPPRAREAVAAFLQPYLPELAALLPLLGRREPVALLGPVGLEIDGSPLDLDA
jgi:protease-4